MTIDAATRLHGKPWQPSMGYQSDGAQPGKKRQDYSSASKERVNAAKHQFPYPAVTLRTSNDEVRRPFDA
jgi:hypothetical protein